MKWRPESRELAYWYRSGDLGQRLPLSLHRLVGPSLISGLL